MDTIKHRLVTKNDFDGMVCGILLKELNFVEKVVFVHPKDIECGKFEITGEDITAGLPYKENVHMAFDHYPAPAMPAEGRKNLTVDPGAPSTSRVIFNYYGKDKLTNINKDILDAVDRGYSAKLTTDEILYPAGWDLLSYLIDHRTGLERYKQFRVSHHELMDELMKEGRGRSIWKMLILPDMQERLNLYFSCIEDYKGQILRCSSVFSNLVVTDTRKEKVIYPGNKFMTYALFPECNVSLNVASAAESGRTVFSAGKSVLDRTCSLDIGGIMKKYGGGGHAGAGACQADNDRAEDTLESLIKKLQYGLFKNMLLGYFNYY